MTPCTMSCGTFFKANKDKPTPHNIAEERRPPVYRGGSVRSHTYGSSASVRY